MRLSKFISANIEPILLEWVAFARRQVPAATGMDEAALLDHGKLILEEIAADMGRPQGDEERQAKSEGLGDCDPSGNMPSGDHARQRERQGFEIEQMVAEYRALRATVLRLWSASSSEVHAQDLEDVIRFNEAVDQAMSESLTVFVAEVTKTRDLFLGMLGHDLRGPLSTIATCGAMVKRTQPANAKPAAMILRSVAQMKALLDDLVEYTRHRLGAGLAIDPTPLQLDQFARDTLEEVDAVTPGCVLEFEALGDMGGQWDARRLHQALSNLVFNALKYGFANMPICVKLDGTRPDEVLLAVQNTGKPIPATILPQLFEPLVRAEAEVEDAHSPVAGANLGLGLYVVREIARAHGGSVEASSDGAQTCFELRLPRHCVRPSPPTLGGAPKKPDDGKPD